MPNTDKLLLTAESFEHQRGFIGPAQRNPPDHASDPWGLGCVCEQNIVFLRAVRCLHRDWSKHTGRLQVRVHVGWPEGSLDWRKCRIAGIGRSFRPGSLIRAIIPE